jgi:hypothetical protein
MWKKNIELKLGLSKNEVDRIALDQLGLSPAERMRADERNEHSVFKDALRHQYDQF